MSHHPNPAQPEIINECVSAVAHGIALGVLDFDYPIIRIDTGVAPFSHALPQHVGTVAGAV